ncbi:MAG: endo-1,4-beta-xylanase [Microcella sp.]|uniref:endo-1,4-beta-xylanase n=1 Tax=Microcella sp. TaxID=1913979 RepID=UPI002726CCDE|nr:endo-1,4-beta-xylanase [Microcella sp.]MDO8338550.1 endo-1,4-beta-xylanase [Microcella sp.]
MSDALARGATDALAHRRGEVELTLLDPAGRPLADREVVVEQVRHAFAFGCIGFDLIDHANGAADESALAADWLELFTLAVLPFYWGEFEPERGHPRTASLQGAARWFRDRGVRVKGHPLVWHTVKARWLDALPDAEIEAIVRARVRREAGDFAGLIDEWDAINEVVIMPDFDNEPDGVPNAISRLARHLGRVEMVRLAVDEARAADPGVRLLLNDFDLSADYERLIEGVLEAGVRLDGIGVQTHMHQGFRGAQLLELADRFGRFGLPVHFTETTIVSGDLMPPDIVDLNDFQPESWPSTPEGEARQAEELEQHYRMLVGHPAVASVTYWGITDRGAWLGAPVGLVRADGSRKPSFDRLRSLVRDQWWLPPTTLRTDGEGRVRVSGFAGDYAVQAADARAEVAVTAGSSAHVVELARS